MDRKINVLLVEDNENDSLIFQTALDDLGYDTDLNIINDSIVAYEYLSSYKVDQDNPNLRQEDIIFLDVNMPQISGIDILKLLKEHDSLKGIPVIMLSSFKNYLDLKKCYHQGANGCVTKPIQIDEYGKLLESSIRFWVHQKVSSKQTTR